jgi:hypothetical protein
MNLSLIITRSALFVSICLSAVISLKLAKEYEYQWDIYNSTYALDHYTTWTAVSWVLITLAIASFAWIWTAFRD